MAKISGLHPARSGRKRQELQIRRLNAELEAKVKARTAELLAANEELHQLARHDALTGLPNRLVAAGPT